MDADTATLRCDTLSGVTERAQYEHALKQFFSRRHPFFSPANRISTRLRKYFVNSVITLNYFQTLCHENLASRNLGNTFYQGKQQHEIAAKSKLTRKLITEITGVKRYALCRIGITSKRNWFVTFLCCSL